MTGALPNTRNSVLEVVQVAAMAVEFIEAKMRACLQDEMPIPEDRAREMVELLAWVRGQLTTAAVDGETANG